MPGWSRYRSGLASKAGMGQVGAVQVQSLPGLKPSPQIFACPIRLWSDNAYQVFVV